jgi:2-polyprenyl-6-methoxyphenol hydroxylase-like FAD-dependent oxidoreductase
MLIPRERGMVRMYVQLDDHIAQTPQRNGNQTYRDIFEVSCRRIREHTRLTNEAERAESSGAVQDRDGRRARVVLYLSRFVNAASGLDIDNNECSVRQSLAQRFITQGRVIITGDAAHSHSPSAGQDISSTATNIT